MSISGSDPESASDPNADPPYSETQVALANWETEWKRAWNAFRNAAEGDEVLWGDRVKPLEVTNKQMDDGLATLYVEGPRGGSYTVKERYKPDGDPRYYSEDSKALDLHLVDADDDSETPFTQYMYDNLVQNLKRQAVSAYVEQDYASFEAAVRDVVATWISDVEFQRWRGWPYDWEADDSQYIFRMIREHAGRMPDVAEGDVLEDSEIASTTPKAQATAILRDVVFERGQELAHEQLITTEEDYNAIVLRLADDAVERSDLKAHMDPREAALSVAEEFVESHTDPVHRAIITYGEDDFIEYDLYDGLDPDEVTQEMAVDVLDQEVWATARAQHKERETHDPTVRGLAFWEFDQLAEKLVEDTLREHRLNDNTVLYTTARTQAREFAAMVEDQRWPYDFGGIDEETWGAGDADDIFSSIVMHAEVDPKVFNPFANDKERRMATQVLAEVVHDRASNALDSSELRASDPVPAEEYLDSELDIEMSFAELREDSGIGPEEFIREAMDALGRKDIDKLAGWTFVDELVEYGNASVPYNAGGWVLVDYGLVNRKDRERRLAWFDRDTGNVLQLEGTTTQRPDGDDGRQQGYGFNDDFSVVLLKYNDNDPQYLTTDQSLSFAFDFVRDYVGADEVDVQVIETPEGEHFIRDAITDDDVDTRAVSEIAPDFSMPGPGFSVEDAFVYGSAKFRDLSALLRRNSEIIDAIAKTAVTLYLGQVVHLMYDKAPGLNIEPTYDKQKGVGIQAGYDFGAQGSDREQYDPEGDTPYFTGSVRSDIYITPGTFKFITSAATPSWLYSTTGRDKSVINNLIETVERPLRSGTGDYFRRERAAFIAVHLPEDPMGRPGSADDYDQDDAPVIEIKDANYTAKYDLEIGESHNADKVARMLERLAIHGYEVETGGDGYIWGGDATLADELELTEDEFGLRRPDDGGAITRGNDANLKPDEVHELGWSLERDMILGSSTAGDRLVGTVAEVADPDENPVCTYKAFLKVYGEFTGTPNSTVLGEVWNFYKDRAEESDEFTLVDAYDRFRMGLVYDLADESMREETREVIQTAAAGKGLDPKAGTQLDFSAHFTKGGEATYVWSLDGEFAAESIFDPDEAPGISEIGDWMLFTKTNRPPDRVEHYYIDGTRDVEYRHHIPGKGEAPANFLDQKFDEQAGAGSGYKVNLADYSDLYSNLLQRVQTDIAESATKSAGITKRDEEFDPDDPVPEEERKRMSQNEADRLERIASGNIRWSDLEGTDKSIFGLFFRGLKTEDAVRVSNRWNLKDRFQTRLSAVLPRNLEPERKDLPTFSSWLERRGESNAIGTATETARQKARYLREMADTIPGVQSGEAMGADPTVEEEIEMMRDVRDHHDDTDYTDYQQFYGEEFGEAFDDVARKFANQRPEQMPDDMPEEMPDSTVDEDQPNQS